MRRLKFLSAIVLASGLLLKACSGAPAGTSDTPAGPSSVPDVVGLYGDDAKDVLKELDLDVEFESIGGETVIVSSNWIVVEQSPEVGEEVATQTEVLLTVARPDDAQEIRAVRLVIDALPENDATWKGATGNAVRIDATTMCVDRFRAAGSGELQGEAAGFVIVSFPKEKLGEPQEGTCAENGAPAATEAPVPAPAPAPEMTLGQKNAVGTARNYLDYTAFSRSGLIGQLEFEGYSTEDAVFAVDHITVDWNEQAAKKAQQYLDYTSFSRQSLLDQLLYEGFSPDEAEYGVSAVGY